MATFLFYCFILLNKRGAKHLSHSSVSVIDFLFLLYPLYYRL